MFLPLGKPTGAWSWPHISVQCQRMNIWDYTSPLRTFIVVDKEQIKQF